MTSHAYLRNIGALSLGLLILTASPSSLEAKDWSQWRGPNRNGSVGHKGSLVGKRQKSLKTAWSKDVGIGYATPSVRGSKLVILGYKKGKDTVYCLNRATGKTLWSYSYPAKNYKAQNIGGTASTPSLTDTHAFTLSRDGQLHCFSLSDGRLEWKINLPRTFKVKIPHFGMSCSPQIVGSVMYLDVGRVVAINANTGQLLWQTKNFGEGFSSPVYFKHQGHAYLACYPNSGLVVVDAKSGKLVADYEFKHKWPNLHAATPLVSRDGSEIFISSGYKLGGAMLRFNGRELKELWRNTIMRNEMASSVLFGELIIGFDNALLKAVSRKTGEELWRQRGMGKGSLIKVGKELVVLSAKGALVIGRASDKGFKPKLEQDVLKGRGCWSAPVYSSGQLLVRDPAGRLLCLNVGSGYKAPPKQPKTKARLY